MWSKAGKKAFLVCIAGKRDAKTVAKYVYLRNLKLVLVKGIFEKEINKRPFLLSKFELFGFCRVEIVLQRGREREEQKKTKRGLSLLSRHLQDFNCNNDVRERERERSQV